MFIQEKPGIALLFLLAISGFIWAQPVDVFIGSDTRVNSATSSPTPYGTHHENLRQQYLYLGSEITAGEGEIGDIESIAFYVQDLNKCMAMTEYTIKIKSTELSSFSSAPIDADGYQTVWYKESYTPVEGWNTHVFSEPFEWDGLSNIIIDIDAKINDTDAAQNASVLYSSVSGTSLRYPDSSTDAGSYSGNATVSSQRANAHFTIRSAPPNIQPNPARINLPGDGHLAKNHTDLKWQTGGRYATGYRISIGTDGGGVVPPTNVISDHDLGLTTTYSHPEPLRHSTTYYWQIVPYNGNAAAENPAIWSFTTNTPLSGTFVIGNGGDYENFTDAITDLNFHEVQVGGGGVTYNVIPAVYNESVPPITSTGSEADPIVIQKIAGSSSNPVLRSPISSSDHVLLLEGVDHVTIDGIDVQNAGKGFEIAGVDGGGCSNITFNNCTISELSYPRTGISFDPSGNNYNNITIQNNNFSNCSRGIRLRSSNYGVVIDSNIFTDISTSGIVVSTMENLTVTNNTVSFVDGGGSSDKRGLHLYGGTSVAGISAMVSGNTISGGLNNPFYYPWGSLWGMDIGGGSYQIFENEISDLRTNGNSPFYGIDIGGSGSIHSNVITNNSMQNSFDGIIARTGVEIYNNRIFDNEITSSRAEKLRAITVWDNNSPIYNNLIYDLRNSLGTASPQIIGIEVRRLSNGPRLQQIYYNTINLDATGAEDNFSTAAVYSEANSFVTDLKNNILVNKSIPGSSGLVAAIWLADSDWEQIDPGSDKNIYYTAGTAQTPIVKIGDSAFQTIAAYKSAAGGRDENSYYEDVPFVSSTIPYDMHILTDVPTNVEGNAIPILARNLHIDFDIDGNSRDQVYPDIGACEGDYLPAPGAPSVSIMRAGQYIQINWDAVPYATGYKVYVSTDPVSFPEDPVATVSTPGYSHLMDDQGQLFFQVTSVVDTGSSGRKTGETHPALNRTTD
ncbi:MAG: right-handed parallel beta-helix repeat-containing protein [Candidatus Syntrophosphaera sp.]